jgi:predicted transcriptional regulator
MQVATGTVIDGKVIVEGVSLREGALVAVVARGADEPFSLSAAQEDELLAAVAEIERGEFVTLEQLLAELPQ